MMNQELINGKISGMLESLIVYTAMYEFEKDIVPDIKYEKIIHDEEHEAAATDENIDQLRNEYQEYLFKMISHIRKDLNSKLSTDINDIRKSILPYMETTGASGILEKILCKARCSK